MSTVFQWIHLTAAVVGVGGIAFLVIVLFPAARVLSLEQRDLLVKAVAGRFRWVTWTVIILLLISGLYNVRQFYWEEAWGPAWADRKSTRLNSSHLVISYAVFCLKKKKK